MHASLLRALDLPSSTIAIFLRRPEYAVSATIATISRLTLARPLWECGAKISDELVEVEHGHSSFTCWPREVLAERLTLQDIHQIESMPPSAIEQATSR